MQVLECKKCGTKPTLILTDNEPEFFLCICRTCSNDKQNATAEPYMAHTLENWNKINEIVKKNDSELLKCKECGIEPVVWSSIVPSKFTVAFCRNFLCKYTEMIKEKSYEETIIAWNMMNEIDDERTTNPLPCKECNNDPIVHSITKNDKFTVVICKNFDCKSKVISKEKSYEDALNNWNDVNKQEIENEIKILPCPFCGNENLYINGVDGENDSFEIVCGKCQIMGKTCFTKEESMKLWNTRYYQTDGY